MTARNMREIINLMEKHNLIENYILDDRPIKDHRKILEIIRQGFEKDTGLQFKIIHDRAEYESYGGIFKADNGAEIKVKISWEPDGSIHKPVMIGSFRGDTIFHYRVESHSEVFSSLLPDDKIQMVIDNETVGKGPHWIPSEDYYDDENDDENDDDVYNDEDGNPYYDDEGNLI